MKFFVRPCILALILALASKATSAADDVHPLSFAEGRYAGFTQATTNDLLWRSERKKSMAVELARYGDGLVLRWYVDGQSHAADITGAITARFSYREVDEVDDVYWRCHIGSAQPDSRRAIRIGLSCAPDQRREDIAVAFIELNVPIDVRTNRPLDSMTVTIAYYRPAAASPSREIIGKLTRVRD